MEMTITGFRQFWSMALSVWHTGVFGRDIGDIIVALLIFAAFYVLRSLCTRLVLYVFARWAQKGAIHINGGFSEAVASPLQFLFFILGFFFATQYLGFEGLSATIVDNISRSLIAIAIFWTLYNAVTPLGIIFRRLDHVLTQEIIDWLITGAKVAVALVGGATVLQIWGIQVAPVIAGLGLFGVAVALGAQDLFKNLIGGLSVLIERRFHIGDWINVDGVVEGTVERIGFRSTLIRRFDKAPVFVPNQQLSDNAVINFTAMTFRRISWVIGIEYRATSDQLRQIRDGIDAYIANNPAFVSPDEASRTVRIDSFGASSIDIVVICFTHATDYAGWMEVKEALAFEIKKIVEGAGAGFAFPSQSLYVETLPDQSPAATQD